jgi:hypothetical protein
MEQQLQSSFQTILLNTTTNYPSAACTAKQARGGRVESGRGLEGGVQVAVAQDEHFDFLKRTWHLLDASNGGVRQVHHVYRFALLLQAAFDLLRAPVLVYPTYKASN